jgi:hypothetical protein
MATTIFEPHLLGPSCWFSKSFCNRNHLFFEGF